MKLPKVVEKITGIAIVELTLFLPVVLTLMIVAADFTRIVMVLIYQYSVLYQTTRVSFSSSPDGNTPSTIEEIIYPKPNEENNFPGIGNRRRQYWESTKDPTSPNFHGKTYYTNKELKVFNIAHGFMRNANSGIYFPIPEMANGSDPAAELQYHTNCSLYFTYNPSLPSPLPATPIPPATPALELTLNRDRQYTIVCRMPLFIGQIFPFIIPNKFLTIRNSMYSWNSGNLL